MVSQRSVVIMQNLAGLKIRSLRRSKSLTQRELAGRAGISASYLNLVELNKRPAGDVLLDRIAAALQVERGLLDGEAERRLIDTLDEIAADPILSEASHPPQSAEELVSRHPDWADLILRLYQTYLDERQAVLALADRLNRDPFLGDSVHRMLTSVTAIRSAAEILHGGGTLEEADRKRFTSIIASDSKRLSGTAASLVAFFDNTSMRVRSATPMEHVDAFIFETDNHFPELEQAASDFLRHKLKGETPMGAAERLLGKAAQSGDDDGLSAIETRRFEMLRRVAGRICADAVQVQVERHPALNSEESRSLAANALLGYTAAAILMPYESFLEEAERRRYDLDALSLLFGVSYEQAAHRVATLRRHGAEGVRFAFMRSDPSGYVTKRLPLPRLPLPRYGTACPIWPIYSAFQTPGVTARGFGALPSGDQFLFFARAVEKKPPLANRPRHLLSVMLACSAADADQVVYGDGVDRRSATVPVGTVCRLCPRAGCGHRQEASLIE